VTTVNSSSQPPLSPPTTDAETTVAPRSSQMLGSMGEFYKLQRNMLMITALLSVVIFGCVWFSYSLHIALNYLIGAGAGVAYLRLLAKNVEKLGAQSGKLGKSHLAVFIGVIIVASQLNQLQILPIFLGFLTYKITLLIYVLQAAFGSNSS
jgi:ATP synthase protein I